MNSGAVTVTIVIGSFVLSVGLTWLARLWLASRQVVDSPNERSLHSGMQVTGGGIAVAAVLVVAWCYLRVLGYQLNAVLLIPVVGLGLLGFVDDIRDLGWLSKLVMQFAILVPIVVAYGPYKGFDMFGFALDARGLGYVLVLLWLVALVNIFNFMDGIDGLASGYSAVCAGVAGVWLTLAGGHGLSMFCYALMAACLGFLVWNWSPAKIFLGDAGSTMLGGTLAWVAVAGQKEFDIPIGAFVLLFAVFLGDTGYTLVRRLRRGERIWRAHREHLYQRAVQSGMSHSTVTGGVIGVSAIISGIASLEMGRLEPRLLWPAICLVVLWLLVGLVKTREKRSNEEI